MKLVVGLGNPGPEYRETRHNIGFLVLDRLAEQLGVGFTKEKWRSLTAQLQVGGERVLLMKPLTYMNRSGEAVGEAVRFFHLAPEQVLAVYDDLDLPFGTLRLRPKGGHGGHNGVRSIISILNSDHFKRIRLGIGRPVGDEAADHVLSPFTAEEKAQLAPFISRGAEAVKDYLETGDFFLVMNRYNQRQMRSDGN